MLAVGELVTKAEPVDVSVRVMIGAVEDADEREVKVPIKCVSYHNGEAGTCCYQLQ